MLLIFLLSFALALSWSCVVGYEAKNGSLLLCQREVFLVENGTRRSFPSGDIFISWDYSFDNVKKILCSELETIPRGPDMQAKPAPQLDINQTEVNELLLELLKETTGVYKDTARYRESIERGVAHLPEYRDVLAKTVVVTGCNRGFVNHLQNFNCFMERLGFKFLVISMDKHTHEYLTTHTNMKSFFYQAKNQEAMEEPTTFRSRHFNMITKRKKHAVYDIMRLGYNVIFSDTDVAVTRDPVPLMLWKNMDYVFSVNVICPYDNHFQFHGCRHRCSEGNTGFYFVRSNDRTIKMWDNSFGAMEANGKLDDQAIFWNVMRHSPDPVVKDYTNCTDIASPVFMGPNNQQAMTICALNVCQFNSGMLGKVMDYATYSDLINNLQARGEVMYALHANYLSGNDRKAQALNEHGFWLATETSPGIWNGKCKELNPMNASYIMDDYKS